MLRILPYLFLLFTFTGYAQQSWCGTKPYDDPDKRLVYQNFLRQARVREASGSISPRTTRNFQVVVHVVAREGYQPVSRAQVLQQLDVLNNDFAAMGDNIGKLLPEFKPLAENANMHFCLATVDPDGQPTSGITYTNTSIENIGTTYGVEGRRVIHYDQLGGKTGWDPYRYINIWVGECLDILGSGTMPGTAHFDEEIGIVVDIRHFGSIGDAGYYNSYGRGHTLTHEMGHLFGLKHVWGDGLSDNCDDSDDIDDTPNEGGPYYGCPEGEQFSCGSSDMYQNFMNLTDDRCLAAFTQGQIARMNSAIDLFYPNLDMEAACLNPLNDFDQWFDQLTWSSDPANDKIIVFHPQVLPGKKMIRVFSMEGRLIFERAWNDELSMLINLQNIASGVYVVNITMEDKCKSRKVVVY